MNIIQNKTIEFDEEDFLWKYIDLHKFLSFVLNKKLFFNRLDNLADPLEGLPESDEASQQTQFANCWYMGEKESFAMWNIYSNPDSVAIRYKPQELIDLVIPSARNHEDKSFTQLIYGYVDYDDIWPFDHNQEDLPKGEYAAFRKDNSYKHEQEFRFVATVTPDKKGQCEYFELLLDNIDKSSFQVLANPYMDGWKFKNITKFLEPYGLDHKLSQSVLKVKK